MMSWTVHSMTGLLIVAALPLAMATSDCNPALQTCSAPIAGSASLLQTRSSVLLTNQAIRSKELEDLATFLKKRNVQLEDIIKRMTFREQEGKKKEQELLAHIKRLETDKGRPTSGEEDGVAAAEGDCACCKKTQPARAAPQCDPKYCTAEGDPHIMAFGGQKKDFVREMLVWLVNAPTTGVKLQAWTAKNGVMKGFAAGGDFLGGHKLTVGMNMKGWPMKGKAVHWDGELILTRRLATTKKLRYWKDDSEVFTNGLITATRSTRLASEGHLDDLGMHGKQSKYGLVHDMNLIADVIHLQLPKGVNVYIAGLNHKTMGGLDILIKMPVCDEGNDDVGVCGSMSETASDDPRFQKGSADDSLFDDWSLAQLAALEADVSNETARASTAGDCKVPIRTAEAACKDIVEKVYRESCIYDACATGDATFAAEAAMEVEAMEVEDARGIPEFVGPGTCLDSEGRKYTAYEIPAVTDKEGCEAKLRKLSGCEAKVEGLRGAQQKEEGPCQILVDAGMDDLVLGESFKKVSEEAGTKIVSDVEATDGYSCWKLN